MASKSEKWTRYAARGVFAKRDHSRHATAEVIISKNTNGNHCWLVMTNPYGYVVADGESISIQKAKKDATSALSAYVDRLAK